MSAGFRYTPASGSTKTHVLARPLAFDVVPGRVKNRWAVDSLDFSNREVVSISSGRMEVEATLRFNRQSQDLIDMLTYAADGLSVTYYPDLNVNTGYALWLVSPSRIDLQPLDGRWYEIRVRFRDASASGTSLESLFSPWLFKYEAGMAVPGAVFTRTGTARQIGQFGVLESVATGLPRDGHWPLVDGVRTPALLLEGARTNLVTSDDISAWSVFGTPVITGSVSDPAGGTGAYTVADDDGAASEFPFRVISFTASDSTSLSFTVRENTMPASGTQRFRLFDTTASAARLILDITGWTDGEPTVSASTGALLGKEQLSDGYWTIYAQSTSVTHTNTNRIEVIPAQTAAETGSIDVYRVNAFDDLAPATSLLDASATVNAETVYLPYTHAPQEQTIYVKFIERGTLDITSGTLLHIGSGTASADAHLTILEASGRYQVLHDPGATQVAALVPNPQPAWGDVVEIRAVLGADGSVQVGRSIDGSAESTSATSAAVDLATAWAGQRLYLNSDGGGSNRGLADFLSVKVAPGTKTLAEMRAL